MTRLAILTATFLAGAYTTRGPGLALLGIGFAIGIGLAVWAYLAYRVVRRLSRALPDNGHPCSGPECNAVVYGRRKYCSLTCTEVAHEARMRQRVHAERMADYGEVPY